MRYREGQRHLKFNVWSEHLYSHLLLEHAHLLRSGAKVKGQGGNIPVYLGGRWPLGNRLEWPS